MTSSRWDSSASARWAAGTSSGFLGRDVEVVAVCDVVKERLDNAKQVVEKKYADRIKSGDYKGVAAYGDFRDLLKHKGLDAVVIATPDHWHAIPAVAAARAGKHIYCEKPLTQNLADGRRICDEVKKAKIVVPDRKPAAERVFEPIPLGRRDDLERPDRHREDHSHRRRRSREAVRPVRAGSSRGNRTGTCGSGRRPSGRITPTCARRASTSTSPRGATTRNTRAADWPTWARTTSTSPSGRCKKDDSGPVEVIPPADPKRGAGLRFIYADGTAMIHNEFEKGPDGKDVRADCVFEGTDGTILVGRDQFEVRFKSGTKAKFPDGRNASPRPATTRRTGWSASAPVRTRSARQRPATEPRRSVILRTSATASGES